jgi:hypothetical protein
MTARSAAPTALDRLSAMHPHHVERIRNAQARVMPGTVATFTGGSESGAAEFFTGIARGSRVVITSRSSISLSVQSIEHGGAHLSVSDPERIALVPLAEWTHADAVAARDAAEKASAEALATARDRRAKGMDDAALKALDDSQESYLLAFALRIFAEYLDSDRLGFMS